MWVKIVQDTVLSHNKESSKTKTVFCNGILKYTAQWQHSTKKEENTFKIVQETQTTKDGTRQDIHIFCSSYNRHNIYCIVKPFRNPKNIFQGNRDNYYKQLTCTSVCWQITMSVQNVQSAKQ